MARRSWIEKKAHAVVMKVNNSPSLAALVILIYFIVQVLLTGMIIS